MCSDPSACPLQRHLSPPEKADDFVGQMRLRLADSGGLATPDELRAQGLPALLVSEWMADGQLRAIPSGSEQWIPLFQLTDERRGLRDDVFAVAEELDGAFDELEILAWFACPNAALGDATPLQRLPENLDAVIQAARLDHFLASA